MSVVKQNLEVIMKNSFFQKSEIHIGRSLCIYFWELSMVKKYFKT